MKKLLSIFSVLMIIFTFSLPAFATDTADTADTIDTSNWITHEIPELGISLALPQGTKVYTRDSLAKGNLDNDPNYDVAVEDFKEDYRYFWALNPEENIDLDLKMDYVVPPLPYPYDSFDHLSDAQLTQLINSLTSSHKNRIYSFFMHNNYIFIQFPPVYQNAFVYHLYHNITRNISYSFDFRLKADEGIERPSAMYDAILSTVDFSNAPDYLFSHIYELVLAAIVAAIAIFALIKSHKSKLDPKL